MYREVTDAMRRRAAKRTSAAGAITTSAKGAVGGESDAVVEKLTLAVFDVLDALVDLHASKARGGDSDSGDGSAAEKKSKRSGTRRPRPTAAAAVASAPAANRSVSSRLRFSLELEPLQRATAALVGEYTHLRSVIR